MQMVGAGLIQMVGGGLTQIVGGPNVNRIPPSTSSPRGAPSSSSSASPSPSSSSGTTSRFLGVGSSATTVPTSEGMTKGGNASSSSPTDPNADTKRALPISSEPIGEELPKSSKHPK